MIITKLQVAPVKLDVSSESSSSCRARRVELVVSSESSCAVQLARHSQNAWARHVECVESSQVEFELHAILTEYAIHSFTANQILH